jgi:hypothetical protein
LVSYVIRALTNVGAGVPVGALRIIRMGAVSPEAVRLYTVAE